MIIISVSVPKWTHSETDVVVLQGNLWKSVWGIWCEVSHLPDVYGRMRRSVAMTILLFIYFLIFILPFTAQLPKGGLQNHNIIIKIKMTPPPPRVKT